MLRIIDLSHHNTTPDWQRAVAEDGVAAIVHKATEGASGYAFADVFTDRIDAIAGSGAIPGGYHFVRSGDGAAQARYFHSIVAPWLDHPAGFLVQADHEGADYDPRPPLSTLYAFAEEWAQLSGGHPITHYFPRWFWQDLGSPTLARHVGPLWASPYIKGSGTFDQLASQVPASAWTGYAGWSRPTIVQFTSSGVVAGVVGLDLNLFDGDRAALAALAGAHPLEEDMPFSCTQHPLAARFAFDADGKLTDRTAVTMLGVPLGGQTGLTRGWVSLSADFSEADADGLVPSVVRVAIAGRTADGKATWNVRPVALTSAAARVPIPLPPNTDKISIGRLDAHSGVGAEVPITATLELA